MQEQPEAIGRLIRAWRHHVDLPFPHNPDPDGEADDFILLVEQDGYLAGHAYSVLGLQPAGNERQEAANERRIAALRAGSAQLRSPARPAPEIKWYRALDDAWSRPGRSAEEQERLQAAREYRDALRELAEALSAALGVSLIRD